MIAEEDTWVNFLHSVGQLSPAGQVAAIIGSTIVICVLIWCFFLFLRGM